MAPIAALIAFRLAVAFWLYPISLDAAPAASTFVVDRSGVELAAQAAADGQWRQPLIEQEISPHLLKAIVAVEDSRFFDHSGVDWRSAFMAAWLDVRALRIERGASTITMQLQRLRDPRPRGWLNKIEQAIRARQLDERLGKRRILVEYLNRAPFGGNIVGAGAASWRYFGRPCGQLSLAEAALLAGLPQSPSRLRPDRHPLAALARRNHVLDRMRALGIIDRSTYEQAMAEPLSGRLHPLPQYLGENRAMAWGAMPALVRLMQLSPGQTIRSTIDLCTEKQAMAVAEERLRSLAPSGVSAACVVVLDAQTSECLASVSLSTSKDASPIIAEGGSPGPFSKSPGLPPSAMKARAIGIAGAIDLARRPRSSGSILKPFIYAAAFDAGVCRPQTVLDDSPASWSGYEPADYDRQFRGSLTAAEALAQSRNIPAMVVLSKVGIEPAIGVMRAAGFRTLTRAHRDYGLSLAIGGAEATPMEVAGAYAALARGGVSIEPTFAMAQSSISTDATTWNETSRVMQLKPSEHESAMIAEGGSPGVSAADPGLAPSAIKGKNVDPKERRHASVGRVTSSRRRALSAAACWQTLIALSQADRTRPLCPGAARLNVAWKTGTSSGHRDAWCAATTRRRTVVVWLGNATGEASPALVGVDAAAPAALTLLASLDLGPQESWPAVTSDELPLPAQRALDRAGAPLALVFPRSGQQFAIDPALPLEQQRVLLKASGAPASGLFWFVDGQPLAVDSTAMQTWWTPARGSHEVRVFDAKGHAATARILVR